MTDEEPTVEIPAWVAREARQELDNLITRTGGPDARDANSPLSEARQRIQDSELSPQATAMVVGILQEVAEERGVEVSDADPLVDRTFRARDVLDNALEDCDSEGGA